MKLGLIQGFTILLLGGSSLAQDSNRRLFPLKSLRTATISVGKSKLTPWLMDTAGKRQEGMMFLKATQLKDNDGMLFIFPYAQPMQFWNQNVSFNLDTAFMDASGKVIGVVVLKAMDTTPKGPRQAGKYVLEMKQGAFKRLGIKIGVKLTLPKGLEALSYRDAGRSRGPERLGLSARSG